MTYLGLKPKSFHTTKYSQPLELVLFHVISICIKCHKGFYYPHLLNNYLFNYSNFSSLTGTKLHLSSAYHPQTDGQSERTIQSLKDLLRACVLEDSGTWDRCLPLIEFTYNNSFHSSIGMAPFEALYGRKCRTPLCWFEAGENLVLGLDMIQQTIEKIQMIRDKLRTTQSRQKTYADKKRRPLEFQEGDDIFLKVIPTNGIGRVMKSKKLTPRFIGLYQILKKIGLVAYQICLFPFLSNLHNVFQVSQLKKYISDPTHVIRPDTVQLKNNLTFDAIHV